jgi:hypothetical protein
MFTIFQVFCVNGRWIERPSFEDFFSLGPVRRNLAYADLLCEENTVCSLKTNNEVVLQNRANHYPTVVCLI